jgi:transitional endoplasmic reticulum ATPase
VPDAILSRLGMLPNELIQVRSYVGRQVFTRVLEGAPEDADTSMVRLGRLLWTQLNVKPGDRLELFRHAPPDEARELGIRPAFHLSHHLGDHVTDFLRKDETVVWPGAKVFAPIFAGGGGVVVQVEGDATAGPRFVGHETRVEFLEPDPEIARRGVTFAEVGGLDSAISRLRDLIELPLLRPGLYRSLGVRAPKGVILHGPPGTGKTLLSRAVAAELGANVAKMGATELVGTYSGETEANLRSLFSEASHHAPTLIIIDEIDVIATNRGRLASQSDVRATTQLLSLMDGLEEVDGVVVLATTNRLDAMDEAFRRPGRFDEELYIGPPDPAARREILSVHTREMPLTREAEGALTEVASGHTAGFTGADLMHLSREAGLAAARRLTSGGSGLEIAESARRTEISILAVDVHEGLQRVTASAMRGLPQLDVELDWDEFDGLAEVKRSLLEAADTALSPGTGRREGVLLTGGSGNGKSALVRALAERAGANLVVVDGSTIFTQWLGESEAAIRSLFGKARDVSPAVVVLEHLDSVAPRRIADHIESAGSRVLSALLSSVDEALGRAGVLVIGVTDRSEIIDPALTRAGRLGLHLEIGPPDEARRRQMLSRLLAGRPDAEIQRLVTETEGHSAAEVDRRARDVSRQHTTH